MQPPGHDVVERAHALEQRDVLECPGDAGGGSLVCPHAAIGLALVDDGAFLRPVEAVDDVEHGTLAGTVRADDRQDLTLADFKTDAVERTNAAERQADVLDLEQHLADPPRRGCSCVTLPVPRAWSTRENVCDRADLQIGADDEPCARPRKPPSPRPEPTNGRNTTPRSNRHSVRRWCRGALCACGSARRHRRRVPCAGSGSA